MSAGPTPPAPAGATPWTSWIDDQCSRVAAAGQWRAPRDLDAAGPVGILTDPVTGATRPVVSFASNDYLGLSHHPAGLAAAHAALDRWGTGAGSARLIVGARPVHRELEAALASWRGCEAAVLFPTGFAANLGTLTTFGTAGTRILSDELNHASIIDGARLARADIAVYRHRDLDHLDHLLVEASAADLRPIVATDTVFSMDGDLAPLDQLVEVCIRRGALLVLDEAHAVLGPDAPDLSGIDGLDVVRVGTLSKSLGSLGGFVAGSRRACDLLINRARSYIFTTASTPADSAAALANLAVLRSAEGDALKARLRAHIDHLRPGHPSPIVPVIVGDEADAVAASARLLDAGLLVPAIRPPTVAPGTSRLRIALSAAHDDDQIERLAKALADAGLNGPSAAGTGPGGPVSPTSDRPIGLRPTTVLVTGTGTEIGKTWLAAAVAGGLRAGGATVSARKPAQSFDPGDDTAGITDAQILAAATGEDPASVCPPDRWYPIALAPPMAAAALGRPAFTIKDLVAELHLPTGAAVTLVETAGGVRSPLADDGDSVDLAHHLAPDLIVLVADPGLGTINAVRLCAEALAPVRPRAGLVVFLNRFDGSDPLHAGNLAWLRDRDGLDCETAVDALVNLIGAAAPPDLR